VTSFGVDRSKTHTRPAAAGGGTAGARAGAEEEEGSPPTETNAAFSARAHTLCTLYVSAVKKKSPPARPPQHSNLFYNRSMDRSIQPRNRSTESQVPSAAMATTARRRQQQHRRRRRHISESTSAGGGTTCKTNKECPTTNERRTRRRSCPPVASVPQTGTQARLSNHRLCRQHHTKPLIFPWSALDHGRQPSARRPRGLLVVDSLGEPRRVKQNIELWAAGGGGRRNLQSTSTSAARAKGGRQLSTEL
jgi:hypothetical protein